MRTKTPKIPGIKKYLSTVTILERRTISCIGPSRTPIIVAGKLLSIIPKSLENLLLSWFEGTESKLEQVVLDKD